MKASELSSYVGRLFFVPDGGVDYLVRCSEAAVVYGTVRLLVAPVAGRGARWVKLASVKPAPADAVPAAVVPSAARVDQTAELLAVAWEDGEASGGFKGWEELGSFVDAWRDVCPRGEGGAS